MNRNKIESQPATIRSELRSLKDPRKARVLSGFFKTGPGEYGEGDRFLGIPVPDIRRIVRTHRQASLKEVLDSLYSEYHEERLAALLLMVDRYQRGDAVLKREIFDLYLKNTACINSWDLVDLTAHHIVGEQLFERKRSLLTKLARSENLWERRIAILATFYFIRQGDSRETLRIAKLLLQDPHDLIHKAVGWMLREVGKRCSIESECLYLDKYASIMPRTMLRYAIERFPTDLKARYMKK
jgi:3-methyladenine DNA glycosylase AlkD